MDDIYTRWPHAELADIYLMFPPDGATSEQIAAGAAVIGTLEGFWKTSIEPRGTGIGSIDGLSAVGIDFEATNSNAIYADCGAIYRIPTLVKQVLNAAFPNAAEYLEPASHQDHSPAPYHGPPLIDAAQHPLLGGILGFLENETFAAVKWRTVSTGLTLVGAPAPSKEAESRIADALMRSRSELRSNIEHLLKWMGSPPHDFLGQLSEMWFESDDAELAKARTLSRFIFTDEKIDGNEAWETRRMSVQTRLRFLLHFPGAVGLFEPYASLGDELMALRHAVDNHRGNMLDELQDLVLINIKDHGGFRGNPKSFIEASRSKEEERIRQRHEEGIEEDKLRDARETHALMTLGVDEFIRRMSSGEELPDLPDDMEP